MGDFHHQDWEKLYWEREGENRDLQERLTELEYNYSISRAQYAKMESAWKSFQEQRKVWVARVEELEKELEREREERC